MAPGVITLPDMADLKVLDTTETDETANPAPEEELVEEDLLVEDVSIDGMCGVY